MANYPTSFYKTEIYNNTGSLVADLTGKYTGLSLRLVKNRPEELRASFDLNVVEDSARTAGLDINDIFAANKNELRISRGPNVLTAGEIQYVQGSAGETSRSIEITAYGWLHLLSKRFTSSYVNYSSQDAGAIAWDLIDDSQTVTNGNFGITQGTIETSKTRDRQYEYKNIAEAIVQLSEVINGFDFEFTYDKVFNVFYPRQSKKTSPILLEYPGNITELSVPIDGTGLVNQVIARGEGFGDEQLITTRNSTSSQTAFKIRQDIADFTDVKETTTLEEHGDEILRTDSLPVAIPQLTLKPQTYPEVKKDIWLDDQVKIKVAEGDYFKYIKDVVYRVEEINISVDDAGVESVKLNVTIA